MKTMKAIIALLTLTACAGVGPVNTPSGNPEVTIKSTATSRIKNALVTLYSGNGYSLVSDGQSNLVFAKQMSLGEATLYTVAMGNSYSSMPNMKIAFTLVTNEGTTRVFAHIGVEMQGGFGQNQGMSFDHGEAGKEVQALLEQLKADMESRVETRSESTSPSETMPPPTTASPAEQPMSGPSATAQPQESPP